MREIKFRGLSLTGDWIYGNLDNQGNMVEIFNRDDGMFSKSVVMPKTIGQYTGLKDKDGIEIYEGDILQSPKGGVRYVKWTDTFKVFVLVDPTGKEIPMNISDYATELIKIIGNIFENKELLKTRG